MKKLIRKTVLLGSVMIATGVYSLASHADGVVVVHPSNSAALDKKQISRIYLGKAKSFSTGSDVKAFDLTEDSPLYEEFVDKVVGKSPRQAKSYWAQQIFTGKGTPPERLDSEQAVKDAVAADKDAIGYIDSSMVDSSVKVVHRF